MLPKISELFQISIDELLGYSYENKAEERAETAPVRDETFQQEINQQVTDIVNREFDVGMREGRIPNAEELADVISDFFLTKEKNE